MHAVSVPDGMHSVDSLYVNTTDHCAKSLSGYTDAHSCSSINISYKRVTYSHMLHSGYYIEPFGLLNHIETS